MQSGASSGPLVRLRDWRLAIVVALALVAAMLAYQAPLAITISIGWFGDRLFLPASEGWSAADADHWYGDELTDDAPGGRSRWTRQAASLTIPSLGATGPLVLTLHAQGWPANALNPAGQPHVIVAANGAPVGQFQPTPAWATYQFTLPAQALTGDDLRLTLRTSSVFTSTEHYVDPRTKGVRIAQLRMQSRDSASMVVPAWPALVWFAAIGALAFAALLRLSERPNVAFVLAVALVSGLAVALALERAWTAALLPWGAGALAGLLLLTLWRPLAWFARQLIDRFRRGAALDYGLVTAALLWALVGGAGLLLALPAPSWAALRATWPEVLLYGLLGLSLVTLLVVYGRGGLPLACARIVAGAASRRGGTLLLALFLLVWVGYEAAVIAQMPYVGHADYADNAAVARNLLQGRGWVVDYVSQFYTLYPGITHPQETWPLLQPVWIVPFFAVFGVSDWAAKLPNLLFIIALALLVYRTGARLWDRRIGLVATILLLTNHFFFKLVIFTTTDLAFTVFAFGALAWLARGQKEEGRRKKEEDNGPRSSVLGLCSSTRHFIISGLFTGLMLLQKPGSGALIALGMGLFAMYDVRFRVYDLRWRLAPVALWAIIALAILSPYLVRNVQAFGKPFYSTESYDAWILEYGDWEEIYKIYTPQAGLSETSGLPDQSWILRWGFDRLERKIAAQVRATRNYLLPPWNNAPLGVSGAGSLLLPMGAWLSLVGLLVALRTHPRLMALLALAFGPYTLFLIFYWHANEERYFVALAPWLVLLAGAALWQAYDRLARVGGGRWTLLGLALVIAAVVATVQPSWPKIADKVEHEPRLLAADLDAYAWLRDNTAPGSVVMTRNPWQLNWHSMRPALMVPNTADRERFLWLARYYGARYLVRDTWQNPSQQTQQLIDRLVADPQLGFEQVYTTPAYNAVNERGQPITLQTVVYRFPDDYGGAAEIEP